MAGRSGLVCHRAPGAKRHVPGQAGRPFPRAASRHLCPAMHAVTAAAGRVEVVAFASEPRFRLVRAGEFHLSRSAKARAVRRIATGIAPDGPMASHKTEWVDMTAHLYKTNLALPWSGPYTHLTLPTHLRDFIRVVSLSSHKNQITSLYLTLKIQNEISYTKDRNDD